MSLNYLPDSPPLPLSNTKDYCTKGESICQLPDTVYFIFRLNCGTMVAVGKKARPFRLYLK